MQLDVYSEDRSPAGIQILQDIHRLRYEVFDRHLGWNVESYNGLELDEFDHSQTFYGAYVSETGVLEGCYRLLPTTSDYMLSKTFAPYFAQSFPSDPQVYECSRFAVHPELLDRVGIQGLVRVTATLLHQQISWAMAHDVHTIICLTDLRFERVLKMSGLSTHRTSEPITIGKTAAVSGRMHPSSKNLYSVERVLSRLAPTFLQDVA